MRVGQLRSLIEGLPDDCTVRPKWVPGSEPGDHEPGVRLCGFEVDGDELLARVELFYLDDLDDWDEEEEVSDELIGR